MKNLIILCLLLVTKQVCIAQKTDNKDLIVHYLSGRFLEKDSMNVNDSIVVTNYGLFNVIDTFFVSTKVIDAKKISIYIYNNSRNIIYTFNTFNKRRQGEFVSFYNSGKVRYKRYYHRGESISPEIWFYEDGSLRGTACLDRKNRSGCNVSYFQDGNIEGESFFTDSSQSAVNFIYYPNSKLKEKIYGFYDNQNFLEYYENGRLKSEGYIYNAPEFPKGKKIEYYETGIIKTIKYYKYIGLNSVPAGEWIFYDEQGKEIARMKNEP